MDYKTLLNKLPKETELHYTKDSTQFFKDNVLPVPKDYNYIIFSETTDYFPDVITSLKNNNIDFIIKKDEWNFKYILIR